MNEVFAALAHPDRRKILSLLRRRGELAAGELAEHFGFTKPTLSHHLKALSQAGLVDREKRGQFVYYRLDQTVMADVLQGLFELFEVRRVLPEEAVGEPADGPQAQNEEDER